MLAVMLVTLYLTMETYPYPNPGPPSRSPSSSPPTNSSNSSIGSGVAGLVDTSVDGAVVGGVGPVRARRVCWAEASAAMRPLRACCSIVIPELVPISPATIPAAPSLWMVLNTVSSKVLKFVC